MRLGLSVAAIVLVLDQLSKWWVVEWLRPPGLEQTPFFSPRVIEVLPFFNIVMAWNRGVSFGLFNRPDADWNWLILSLLSLAVVAALLVWLRRAPGRLVPVALGLIIGGAVGNIIDRLRWGAVADFLDVHVAGWHWPAFNIADSGITIGAALLVFDALFSARDSHKTSS